MNLTVVFLFFFSGNKRKGMADDKAAVVEGEKKETSPTAAGNEKKKRRGFFSRIWNGIFRLHGDDFEKRLQYISKEEAAVIARMTRRSRSWRRMSRHLIIFSVIFEVCYMFSNIVVNGLLYFH